MYTDSFFLSAADQAVRLQLPTTVAAPIYYYYFAYRGHHSFSEVFGDPNRDFGELDELFFTEVARIRFSKSSLN